jgi:hypothetical protein
LKARLSCAVRVAKMLDRDEAGYRRALRWLLVRRCDDVRKSGIEGETEVLEQIRHVSLEKARPKFTNAHITWLPPTNGVEARLSRGRNPFLIR